MIKCNGQGPCKRASEARDGCERGEDGDEGTCAGRREDGGSRMGGKDGACTERRDRADRVDLEGAFTEKLEACLNQIIKGRETQPTRDVDVTRLEINGEPQVIFSIRRDAIVPYQRVGEHKNLAPVRGIGERFWIADH